MKHMMFRRKMGMLVIGFIMATNTLSASTMGNVSDQSVVNNEESNEESNILPYLNVNLTFEERAADLVSRMTLEEKANQMQYNAAAIPRLGVKAYNWWSEAIHGVARSGPATSFPVSIAMSSTWNPDLIREIADATSDEARGYTDKNGKGLVYWSPTINLSRDPRWGRNEETYGEDPFLTTQIAKGFVEGMQGDDERYLKTVSTIKHFAANNSEFNRHWGSADMDDRTLREYYTSTFKTIIEETNVGSIMTAYNAINGTPVSVNTYLLDDLLRKTWGFDGYVVSDCWAISDIYNQHKWVPEGWDRPVNATETTAFAIKAGTDLNCGNTYLPNIIPAINQGILSEDDVDIALVRLFTARMQTGEFDPLEMVEYAQLKKDEIEAADHAKIALKAAQESIVMLKNESSTGDTAPILPLKAESINKIAVVGVLADQVELGGYSGSPTHTTTPLAGIRAAMKEKNPDATVEYYPIGSTSQGEYLFNVDYFELMTDDGVRKIEAETLSDSKGLKNEGSNLGYITGNSWAKYSNVNLSDVKKIKVKASAAADAPGGRVEVRYGALDGPIVASVDIDRTGNWGQYKEFEGEYNQGGFQGEKDLYLVFKPKGIDQEISEEQKKAISEADAVIVYVGTVLHDADEEKDRATLALPRKQGELAKEVAAINANTVTVMQSMGQVDVEDFKDDVPALLWTGYNGQAQGEALADILFGDVNPSGKLSYTWYTNEEDIPDIADYTIRNSETYNGRTYQYFDEEVSYPFGHGLSYTTFAYDNLKVSEQAITPNDSFTVSVDVTNTGDVIGDEVVQLYVVSPNAESYERPEKQLKGFQKVTLNPGETKTINIEVDAKDLYFWDEANKTQVVDNGTYTLEIGTSSQDIKRTIPLQVEGELDTYLKHFTIKSDGVQINKNNPTITSEVTAVANTEVFYDLSETTVKYTTSNPAVAVVNDEGNVTGVGTGVATITAEVTIDGITMEDSFPVEVKMPLVKQIFIDNQKLKGFSPGVFDYTVSVSNISKVPKITVDTDAYTSIEIIEAEKVPGVTKIKATNGQTTEEYNIHFVGAPVGDDFTDGTMGDQWTILNEETSGWSIEEGRGLRLATLAGDIYEGTNNAKNIVVQEATGDWEAITKIDFSEVPSQNFQNAGIMAYQDDDNYVKLSYEYQGPNLAIQLASETNGSSSTHNKVANEITGKTVYLKLKKEGNNYEAFYSADGEEFKRLGTTDKELNNTKIGLISTKNRSSAKTIDAYFNYVDIKVPNQPDENQATIGLEGPDEVTKGESFEVAIGIDQLKEKVYATDLLIEYNDEVFDLEKINYDVPVMMAGKEEQEGILRVLLGIEDGIIDRTQLLSLNFKVNPDTESGSGTIGITQAELGQIANEIATATDVAGMKKNIVIKGEPPVVTDPEDVNQDQKVDVADLALIGYYYRVKEGEGNWEEAKKVDVNKDGVIDIRDLVLVANKILDK